VLLLLKNASLSGTLRVLAGIDHVAYALDLTLPNLNGPMLLAKAAVDLGIPQVRWNDMRWDEVTCCTQV
jgi:hypothetical protein